MVPLRFAQLANGVLQPVEHLGGRVEVGEIAALPLTSNIVLSVVNVSAIDAVCDEADCEGCHLAEEVEKACVQQGSVTPEQKVSDHENTDESDGDETVKSVACALDEDEAVSLCVFVHRECVVNEDLFDDDDSVSIVSAEVMEPLPFEYQDSCDESDQGSVVEGECSSADETMSGNVCEVAGEIDGVPFMDDVEHCVATGGVMPTKGCVDIEDLGDDESTCVTDADAVDLFPHGNPAFELRSCSVKVTNCATLLQDGVYLVKAAQKKRKRRCVRPAQYARNPKHFVCCNYVCRECDKCFRYQHTFKAHCLRHHKKVPCHFAHCLEVFITRGVMLAHAQTHALKRYECVTCKKVFKHMSVRDRHAVVHSSAPASYTCAFCDKKYVRSADLLHHDKQVHAHVKRKDMHVCEDCGKTFKTRRQLGYHSKVHKEKEIKCSQCDEMFRHYQARKRHVQKMH